MGSRTKGQHRSNGANSSSHGGVHPKCQNRSGINPFPSSPWARWGPWAAQASLCGSGFPVLCSSPIPEERVQGQRRLRRSDLPDPPPCPLPPPARAYPETHPSPAPGAWETPRSTSKASRDLQQLAPPQMGCNLLICVPSLPLIKPMSCQSPSSPHHLWKSLGRGWAALPG